MGTRGLAFVQVMPDTESWLSIRKGSALSLKRQRWCQINRIGFSARIAEFSGGVLQALDPGEAQWQPDSRLAMRVQRWCGAKFHEESAIFLVAS